MVLLLMMTQNMPFEDVIRQTCLVLEDNDANILVFHNLWHPYNQLNEPIPVIAYNIVLKTK